MLHARLRAAAGRDRIPTDGLVARYDLDSSLVDTSGNGFDGTAVSSVAYTPGVVGDAIDGDGVNYVSLPNLGISGAQPRTISFWARRGASGSIKTLVAWNEAASSYLTNCIIHTGAVSAGDVYWGFSNNDFYTGGGLITTAAWHHVRLVYRGGTLSTSTVSIYVDNVARSLSRVGSSSGAADTASANYRLMSDSLGPRIFDGDLDLVRIYNRETSDSEGDLLYAEGA